MIIQDGLFTDEYKEFVDKFKPKRTTDDCYTPEPVYNLILDYVRQRYDISEDTEIVRPFWPGGDYLAYDYPPSCCVIDNPPFSILSEIVKTYQEKKIRFFLFAPYLTCMNVTKYGATVIITGSSIIYENGAEVPTAFCTNLEPENAARSDPELAQAIKILQTKDKKELPKYRYPAAVVTATSLGYLAGKGIGISVPASEAVFIRKLDAMPSGKGIFGSALLVSQAQAQEFSLSPREKFIQEELAR